MGEDQNNVMEEVVPHDQEPAVIENKQAEVPEAPKEDQQDKNWRELRRQQKEDKQKLKMQEEIIEKLLRSQAPVKANEPEERIAADDFITLRQSEKHAEMIAERKYRELDEQKERSRFVERLKSKYTDFSDIVNPDSIAIFEEKEPELAATIADLKDPYKMGLQTYRFIKSMNITEEVPERRHTKEVEKKLEKNEKLVQSPQAYNKRPMAQAFRMTDADKKALYEEMMQHASGSGY